MAKVKNMQQKRVFIVHGWGDGPEDDWFPWLKRELEARGFDVNALSMPDTENPRIENWVPHLLKAVGEPDEHTYFVGHSIGCQTVARYLESLPKGVKAGGAVFVGGFFKRLTNLEGAEEEAIASPWLTRPVDFQKVKLRLEKSIAIFSDDDPWVPLDNADDFRDKLGSEIVIVNKAGHFGKDDGCFELPVALQSLLKIARG